jgi:Flp pilus assembly pilin Flp
MHPMNRKAKGQGMTEFIVIVALVSMGALAGITYFGDTVRGIWGQSSDAVSGSQAVSSASYDLSHGRGKNQKQLANRQRANTNLGPTSPEAMAAAAARE